MGIDQVEDGDRAACVLALGQLFGQTRFFQRAKQGIFLLGDIRIRRDGIFHFTPCRQRRICVIGDGRFGLGDGGVALRIQATAGEQRLDQAGDYARGDAFGVYHVSEFGFAGRERPRQAKGGAQRKPRLFSPQAGGDDVGFGAGDVRTTGQKAHRIALNDQRIKRWQFGSGLDFSGRVATQQDFKPASGFSRRLATLGDIRLGAGDGAARGADIQRFGEAALEAALGQNANAVTRFIGQNGDAFLREGSIQIDPCDSGLRADGQFCCGEIGFARGKVCFRGGDATPETIPQIGFLAGVEAKAINTVGRPLKIVADLERVRGDAGADRAVDAGQAL